MKNRVMLISPTSSDALEFVQRVMKRNLPTEEGSRLFTLTIGTNGLASAMPGYGRFAAATRPHGRRHDGEVPDTHRTIDPNVVRGPSRKESRNEGANLEQDGWMLSNMAKPAP